ncbi:MAG: stalk domain-containing protein [Bacillota bacterium]
MRRSLLIILFLILFNLGIIYPVWAEESKFTIGQTTYKMNGYTYTMDIAPYIKDGRTYLPLRYVAQALGVADANILWDGAAKRATLIKGNTIVQLTVGSNIMMVNGMPIAMDVEPEITIDRTMLPIRYVAEVFGASVVWDDSTQEAVISNYALPGQQTYIDFLSEPDPLIDTFPVIYTWNYGNYSFKWGPFHVPIETLNLYRKKEHPLLTPQYNEIYNQINTYLDDPDGEKILSNIIEGLKKSAEEHGFDKYQTVEFVVSFVQGLPYVSDSDSTLHDEYPKYPVETLLERGGDCEDSAILTAVLLRKLGFGSALLFLPEEHHVAAGILASKDAYGTYYRYEGKRYLYIETTNSGWRIGQLPMSIKKANAYVIPLP